MGAFGIDLGTTCSFIASMSEEHSIQIVPNEQGRSSIPSFVRPDPEEEEKPWSFGCAVRQSRSESPECTLYDIRRMIGRRFADPEIQTAIKNKTRKLKLRYGEDTEIQVELPSDPDPLFLPPWEISSRFLGYLIDLGNGYVPSESRVRDAAIAIPAYFSDDQRTETKLAAEAAGINVLQLINEPPAAAVAVRHLRPTLETGVVLVYGFGGGTVDASLMNARGGDIEVPGTSGNTALGSRDLDQRLIDFCVAESQREQGIDLRTSASSIEPLIDACGAAKETLSRADRAKIFVENIVNARPVKMYIAGAKFEDLCADIFDQCLTPVDKVLGDKADAMTKSIKSFWPVEVR
jgi:L1 cell adhesion molecule like protein